MRALSMAFALSVLASVIPAAAGDPSGRFLVMDTFAEGGEVPPWFFYLTLEDGYAGFELILPEPPTKEACDAGGPCTWISLPLTLITSSDANDRLQIDRFTHQRDRAVVSRETDSEQIMEPILEFMEGARFVARNKDAQLVKDDRTVELLSIERREAIDAIMLSQFAAPRDGALSRCFARQIVQLRSDRADHAELLRVSWLAGYLGELREIPAFWRNMPYEAKEGAYDLELRKQRMAVIDAMLSAPYERGETAEALFDTAVSDAILAADLNADGRTVSSAFMKKHQESLLALRRYANWLETELDMLNDRERRERLCQSILMDRSRE